MKVEIQTVDFGPFWYGVGNTGMVVVQFRYVLYVVESVGIAMPRATSDGRGALFWRVVAGVAAGFVVVAEVRGAGTIAC